MTETESIVETNNLSIMDDCTNVFIVNNNK